MPTGVFGGTFDPIHNAHLMVARVAMEAAGLDRVVFMPAGTPPHKLPGALSPASDRLAMARLAVEGEGRFEVSDLEIRTPGVDYTVDTLGLLKAREPDTELWFIMGGDSLAMMDQWREPETLLRLASFVAVYRPGHDLKELEAKRRELIQKFGGQILLVPCHGMEISSSDIRRRVAAGQDISGLVPAAVADYIRTNGLYREGK